MVSEEIITAEDDGACAGSPEEVVTAEGDDAGTGRPSRAAASPFASPSEERAREQDKGDEGGGGAEDKGFAGCASAARRRARTLASGVRKKVISDP
jgi:hypothetical protein